MNTQPCEQCHQIIVYTSGSTNKPNVQMIRIGGNLVLYKNGFKNYVKPCCLMAYYVGRDGMSNYMINQSFDSIVKPKAPKYVFTDNAAFPVHEITLKPEETIRHPEWTHVNYKLEIHRNMNIQEFSGNYNIVTKAAYNKKLKEHQQKAQDIDMEGCRGGSTTAKPQYVYLIQERTAAVANQSIYKIGRTEQPNFDRFKGYVKGYKILLHVACDDCRDSEQAIMNVFKSKYRHAIEYGNEYFEGNPKTMIRDIASIVFG